MVDDTRLKEFYEGLADRALAVPGPGCAIGTIDGIRVFALSADLIEEFKTQDLGDPFAGGNTTLSILRNGRGCFFFRGDS